MTMPPDGVLGAGRHKPLPPHFVRYPPVDLDRLARVIPPESTPKKRVLEIIHRTIGIPANDPAAAESYLNSLVEHELVRRDRGRGRFKRADPLPAPEVDEKPKKAEPKPKPQPPVIPDIENGWRGPGTGYLKPIRFGGTDENPVWFHPC